METRVVQPQPARSVALVEPYLWALALACAGILAATSIGVYRDLGTYRGLGLDRWALLAGLMIGSYVVLTHLMLFDWRGQRVALGPDEVLVFLALAALPPTAVVLFAVPTMAIYQVKTRRPFLRAASNVAVVTLASAACASAFVLLAASLPWLVAASIAIVVYTFTTHLLVSTVYSLRESVPVHVVFGERFWIPTLLHIALGVSGGTVILGLWSIHPAALAALVPFAYLAKEHVSLSARREREHAAAARLGTMTRELAGEREIDEVAKQVVAACGDIFHAGRVAFLLGDKGDERQWSRDFDGGWRAGEAPLAASLPGTAGALLLHRNRRMNEPFNDTDRALLAVVAGAAASAVANARAMRDLASERRAVEEALLSQRVARPLVRRIVRGLMIETHADALVLMRLGEQLAAGLETKEIGDATKAYREMGLGSLRLVSSEGPRFEFHGSDLFERAESSRTTTCYLALGFLCGVVGRAHGGQARGTEKSCQSRGEHDCHFVVTVRSG